LTIGNNHTIFAEEGDLGPIWTPDNIFDLGGGEFAQDTSTLDFEKDCTIVSAEDDSARCSPIIEAINIWHRCCNTLGSLIVHVLDYNLTLVAIQNGKAVASQEDTGSQARTSLAIGD
jgi:hypothetical protein